MGAGGWPTQAHEQENVADKWNEYPERRNAFFAWHRDITAVLEELVQLQGKGLHVGASRMSEVFSAVPVQLAAQRYGDTLRQQTETGNPTHEQRRPAHE